MRKTIMAGILGLVIGATGAGAAVSWAQPAPGGPGGPGGPGHPPAPWMHHGGWEHKGPWHHGPATWHHRPGRLVAPGTFALVYREHDRNLSPADVTTIAEAFLLMHGNHSWKVGDVAAQGSDLIGFAFTTPKGEAIAHFTINRHNGHIARVN